MVINLTDTDYSTEVQDVVDALNAVYENKQANKKNDISGDYSSDNTSYPTVKAVKAAYGNKVTSWSSTVSDSNIPSEKLVKDSLDGKADTGHNHDTSYSALGHTHGTGDVTNSATLSNIGSNLSTQSDINSALNTVIGVLKGTKFIEIENKPSTASADTMGKLYIVTENGKVNVYYSKATESGGTTTYSWEELDANILDDIADATQSVHGWMSASDKIKLDKSQAVAVTQFTGYSVDSSSEKLTLNVNTLDSFTDGSVFVAYLDSTVTSYIHSNYSTISEYNVYVKIYDTNLSYPSNAKVKDIYLNNSMGFASLFYLRHPTSTTRRAYLLNKNARDHTHSISEITNLQTTLNGKASTSDMINEVKVFAGQLADAINPSS